ncbi:hypothetical protein D3C74_293280 [compost metagenome]
MFSSNPMNIAIPGVQLSFFLLALYDRPVLTDTSVLHLHVFVSTWLYPCRTVVIHVLSGREQKFLLFVWIDT